MIESILNMFTDSLSPKVVIMWFRRRISYRNRIAKSKSIPYKYLMDCLAETPKIQNEIRYACYEYKAENLLLIAYPTIDNRKYWQCTGIDNKYKYLFELKLNLSKTSFNLNKNEMYNIYVGEIHNIVHE